MNRQLNVIRENIFPRSILRKGGKWNNERCLLEKKDVQIGLNEPNLAVIDGAGYILFDFGKEYSGGIRILTYSIENKYKDVRIRFGESLSEAMTDIGEDSTATNDHSLRDFNAKLVGLSDMTFGNSGFRFVRLDFSGEGTCMLKAVTLSYEHSSIKRSGLFTCDDADVNKIYSTAARTLEMCIQNGYIYDGIKRDRLVWIGDLHPEALGMFGLYKDLSPIKNSLRFAAEQTAEGAWINNIPSYSLWWLIILDDYYLHSGDFEFLAEMSVYAKCFFEQLSACVKPSGEVVFPDYFFDWSVPEQADRRAALQAIALWAAEGTERIYKALLDDTAAPRLLAAKICKYSTTANAKQSLALMTLTGLFDGAEAQLTENRTQGFSTFMCGYILRAIAKTNPDLALELMKEYYGGMLDLGATTFFENFDLESAQGACRLNRSPQRGQKDFHRDYGADCYKGFRHSLCHGWSCGALSFLTDVVLGVTVKEVGCRIIEIKPNMCGLQHVKGYYPTPFGRVTIEHTVQMSGNVSTTYQAPEGVTVILV